MGKVLIGGGVGGLILFLWGAVSHMLLPVGHWGFGTLAPAEDAVLAAAVRGSVGTHAIYLFPDAAASANGAPAGPGRGFLMYDPASRREAEPGARQLVCEYLWDVVAALLAAFVLVHVAPDVGYARRVLLATAFGLFAVASVDAAFVTWYGFPHAYLGAQVVDAAGGAFLAGLFLARACRR